MERQIREGLLISEHRGGPTMNRKGEWGQNVPPKFGLLDEVVRTKKRIKVEHSEEQEKSQSKRLRRQEIGDLGDSSSSNYVQIKIYNFLIVFQSILNI